MIDTGLIIFVKNPESGNAKTRIANSVGTAKAMQIYIKLLELTLDLCLKFEGVKYLFYQDKINLRDLWPNDRFIKEVQADGDLGHKMQAAFRTVRKDCDNVLIIGSDCPYLSQDILRKAQLQLGQYDIVIGPSTDGGYYMIGLSHGVSLSVFEEIEWSTDKVFSQTIANIDDLGLSYYVLPTLSDIDYYEDWEAYESWIKSSINEY